MSTPLIHVEHLDYRYPFTEAYALKDVSFSVSRGEVVLVTGSSGCGKSTLLKVLNGLIPGHFKGTLAGQVEVKGAVGTVLQNPDEQILATTVEEEIALALEWQSIPSEEIRAKVDHAMAMFGLSEIATRSVFKLSSGERQKCVLAAVVAAGHDIIVLDEPTANLSPEATEELALICRTLKAKGKTIVIVDHRLYWLRGILDQLVVLREGRVARTFRAEQGRDVLDDLAAQKDLPMWGLRNTHVMAPNLTAIQDFHAPRAFSLANLSFRFSRKTENLYEGFSCVLPRGAVCAVTGPNGAGKTTLARLLCGLLKPNAGQILDESDVPLKPRHLRARTAFAMQQMDIQLYMHTVEEELRFSALRNRGREEVTHDVAHWLAHFGLVSLRTRHPQSLSGGEKQRLVIACALMKCPDVLILDEPTSGLDGHNMCLIADALAEYAARGGTALVITHDLELLARVANCCLQVVPLERKRQ